MILLRDPETNDPRIAVLGVGLVGSALVETLCQQSPFLSDHMPLSWTDGERQAVELRDLEEALNVRSGQLDIVWSAGSAGFSTTEEQTAVELESFRRTLAMVERLADKDRVVSLHVMSSAGGLFEGQRLVSADSTPDPQRPYGELKRAQEELLLASDAPIAKRIYRLTSVYGYIRPEFRRGLIPTLVWNGLRQRVSHIFARPSTLRDFIWVGDIADFVTRTILDGTSRGTESAILASGKPTSVREIQIMVEQVLNRQLYVSYSLEPPNSEDITFAAGVVADGWHSSNLGLTLRKIYDDALQRGVTAAES